MKEAFSEIWLGSPAWIKYGAIGVTAFISLIIFVLSYFSTSYKKDNPIEQAVEEIIKTETGLDVDLSKDDKTQGK